MRTAAPVTSTITLALSLLALPSVARADVTKEQCVDANAKAQDLRRDHKISLAREQLRLCSDAACPAIVRSDCVKRLDDLEAAQPTITVGAKDGAGRDLIDVTVTVDGQKVTDKLDGSSLRVDPGPHTVTVEASGLAPVTRTLVLSEGDKGRHVDAVLLAPVAPGEAAASPGRTQRLLGWTSGGVGVAGLVLGGAFGGLAISKKSAAGACPTTCDAATYRSASGASSDGHTYATVSTVGFIAGGVLAATGAVLLLTAPKGSAATSAAALSVTPSVGASGGGLVAIGVF